MESAGRVLIIPKGAWDAQTEYHMLDAVRYQGSMYVAKRTNTNVTPVDGADWFLSAEGAQNGGHTIQDPSGTSFTQRNGLQFTDAKVTDDGTNNTTKIEIVQTETASEFENETADGLYNVTGEDDEFFTSEDIEYRTNTSVKQALDRHESSMAFVENGDTSVGAYTAGQYIVHGDKFYEVKSTIAAGDTFTTGTNGNIEEKNIGQVITAINSNLTQKIAQVNSDGIKTISVLLNEMYGLISSYLNDAYDVVLIYNHVVLRQGAGANFIRVGYDVGNNYVNIDSYALASSGSKEIRTTISSGGNTITDISNSVIPSGYNIVAYATKRLS